MLTNNLDFKRAIAQQFDPDTDYSEFGAAEIDGAFEATVYQLLMERQGARHSKQDANFSPASFIEKSVKEGIDNQSLDEAKAAYLREMPSDYFGGIKEVRLGDLEQYRKPSETSVAIGASFAEQLTDIKETLTEFFTLIPPSPNFSEDAVIKVVGEALAKIAEGMAPHVAKLDSLIAKLEFGEPIQLEGEILEDGEFVAIASTDSKDIQAAVDDWNKEVPNNTKNLIGVGKDVID